MRSPLDHFSIYQREQLLTLCREIATVANIDKIFCYGTRTIYMQHWSPFQFENDIKTTAVTACDLALVLYADDTRSDTQIARLMKRFSNPFYSISYVIERNGTFYAKVETNDRFAIMLCRKATLLYDGSGVRITLRSTRCLFNPKDRKMMISWVDCISYAQKSLREACQALPDSCVQATSLLCISAISICAGLIYLYTGFYPVRRSLRELLQLCDNFCAIRSRCFPCNTRIEKVLLKLLEKARNSEVENQALHIPHQAVNILIDRVGTMHQFAQEYSTQKGVSSINQ